MKTKNSAIHDNLNSKIIKELKNEVKEPINIITNKSLKEGIFPEQYKLAAISRHVFE